MTRTMNEWREIRAFPGYSVSDEGSVKNDRTGRIMAKLVNQSGVVSVGLMRGNRQHKRTVSILVAEAFMNEKPNEAFDALINLDGDRYNNRVSNLAWRPRWFAVKYFRQFKTGPAGFTKPIEEVTTRELFENSWDAAIKYGLLESEIFISTINRTRVWPTYHKFRVLY